MFKFLKNNLCEKYCLFLSIILQLVIVDTAENSANCFWKGYSVLTKEIIISIGLGLFFGHLIINWVLGSIWKGFMLGLFSLITVVMILFFVRIWLFYGVKNNDKCWLSRI